MNSATETGGRPPVDANLVKASARGHWSSILQQLAPALAEALDTKGRHVECPVHQGRHGDAFRVFRDVELTGGGICNTCGPRPDGFAMLQWLNGWRFPEAVEQVGKWLGIADAENLERRSAPRQAKQSAADAHHRLARLKAVWTESMPIDWNAEGPLTRYLCRRGLSAIADDPPRNLREHGALPYWQDGAVLSRHPAMIAPVLSPSGRGVSLHRTYLTESGRKAPLSSPKKLMPAVSVGATMGGAVRLYPARWRMIVAEGIETALALRLALKEPVWATVSAGGMAGLEVPETIREVCIYADNDQSGAGQGAAEKLLKRLRDQGRSVSVALPPKAGMDWLDVFTSSEVAA